MHMVHVYWEKKKKVRKSPNNIVTSLVIYCFKPLKIRSDVHTTVSMIMIIYLS